MLCVYEHINIAILNGSPFTENKGLIDCLQVIWFIHMAKIYQFTCFICRLQLKYLPNGASARVLAQQRKRD